MESGKSGIDILDEILNKLAIMEQKIDILDQNIKKVANSTKIAELIDKVKDTPLQNYTQELDQIKKQYTNILNTNKPSIKAFDPSELNIKKETKIFVKGKVIIKVGNDNVPVTLADVTIYNDKDEIVKQTRTNMAGEYSASLPVGRYVAEIKGKYKNKDLVPQNISFVVNEGDKEVIIK